jgi:hypothetical protein
MSINLFTLLFIRSSRLFSLALVQTSCRNVQCLCGVREHVFKGELGGQNWRGRQGGRNYPQSDN